MSSRSNVFSRHVDLPPPSLKGRQAMLCLHFAILPKAQDGSTRELWRRGHTHAAPPLLSTLDSSSPDPLPKIAIKPSSVLKAPAHKLYTSQRPQRANSSSDLLSSSLPGQGQSRSKSQASGQRYLSEIDPYDAGYWSTSASSWRKEWQQHLLQRVSKSASSLHSIDPDGASSSHAGTSASSRRSSGPKLKVFKTLPRLVNFKVRMTSPVSNADCCLHHCWFDDGH